MALIKCRECNHQVSDKAAACPKCGAPIAIAREATAREAMAAGAQIKMLRKTRRKFRLQALISVSLIIIGFVWLIAALGNPQSGSSVMPFLVMCIGFVWYAINRLRSLWHNKSIFIGLAWYAINRFRIWWHQK